jgi:hypothetical protein
VEFGPTGITRVSPVNHGGWARTVIIPFPNAKIALDWVRWALFQDWNDPVRRAGEWLVAKFRTQIAESRDAGGNMTKQGVPPDTRLFIAEGA